MILTLSNDDVVRHVDMTLVPERIWHSVGQERIAINQRDGYG
jgi:hypothetical protein